jgi:hypothetical protein
MVGLEAIPRFEELETREGPQIISKHGIVTRTTFFLCKALTFFFFPFPILPLFNLYFLWATLQAHGTCHYFFL